MSDAHNLAWYEAEMEKIAAEVFMSLRKLGELLIHAGKDLSADDYAMVENCCLTMWNRADLRAAQAVAKGDLHPDLFPAGGKNSKVLSLSEIDQKRLLSDEEFDVWGNDGRLRHKTWRQMSPDERDRLLGPKGSRLHPPDEQRKPGPKRSANVALYEKASYRDGKLSLTGGKQRGETQDGAIIASMDPGELENLVTVLLKGLPPERARTIVEAALAAA